MCKSSEKGEGILLVKKANTKSCEFPLDLCVEVEKKVIWHYAFRRDLEVLNAPALHWLWFGAQEATAPEGEGPSSAFCTYLQMFFDGFWASKVASRRYNNKKHILAPIRFPCI